MTSRGLCRALSEQAREQSAKAHGELESTRHELTRKLTSEQESVARLQVHRPSLDLP